VNFFRKICAKVEGRVKSCEESINGKFCSTKRKLILSLIPENQPVVFMKQPVVYTSRFEKQC